MAATHEDRNAQLSPGVAIKAPCKAATIGAITLSGEQTVDGVALVSGDRCLVKNQVDQTANGIYGVSTGSWAREPDFDGTRDVVTGTFVFITNGATNAGAFYECTTTGTIVFGTSNITFAVGALGPITTPLSIVNGGTGSATGSVANLIFLQSGTGAVARTVQSKERDFVTPEDFGAVGNGIAIDIGAVQAAINTGLSVYFPDGIFFLGTFNTAATEVNVLTIIGRSNTRYWGPGILKVTSANTCVPKIIELDNSHDIELDLRFTDSGYDETLTYQGAMCVNLLGTAGPVFNVRAKLNSNGCVVTFNTGNQAATVPANAIYNIELDLNCKNSFYGAQFRNCGDHVHGVVKTETAHRSYFSYGAQHHKIDVFSKNHSNVNPAQDCLIKTYDGRDEQDIEINYKCQGNTSATPPVEIENQTTTGKAVRDVTVTINDSDSTNTNTQSLYIVSRDINGAILATSANIITGLRIGGRMRWVPQFGTAVSGGVINYVEFFGDVARKLTSPNQLVNGTTYPALGNPGFVSNVGWRLRMPDGMTWIVYRGNDNSAIFDIPLTAADSMGMMKVEVHVYDGYQATTIWKHELDNIVWTKAAGVATLSSRTVEINTNLGAVGTINLAANAGNMRYTFAGWTAAANGLIILRYEDQQSDAATAD